MIPFFQNYIAIEIPHTPKTLEEDIDRKNISHPTTYIKRHGT